MKAILVIDVNDDTDLSSEADVIIENGDFRLETKAFLKPMPKWKYAVQGMKGYTRIVNECNGWNECISEILGEEE